MAINGSDNGDSNLLAAGINNAVTAVANKLTGNDAGQYSVAQFIQKLNQLGYTIQSRYECSFSLIPNLTFYIRSVQTPEMRREFTTVYIDGREVYIPTIIEYGHEVTMNVLNDEKGAIYSTFCSTMQNSAALNGMVTISVKTFGDGHKSSSGGVGGFLDKIGKPTATGGQDGLLINLSGCRLETVGGLTFDSSSNDLQTFDVTFKINTWSVSPSNFMDALATSIGGGALGGLLNTGLGGLV